MNCINSRIIINQKLFINGVRSILKNERTFHSSYRLNHVFTNNKKSNTPRNFRFNNVTLVRLASTTVYQKTNLLENENLNSLQDVSFDFSQSQTGFETDLTTEIAAKVVEPSLKSLGLCGGSPWGLLQYGLEYLHVNVGLPWWGTVVLSTVIIRLLMVPVVITIKKQQLKFQKIQPIMQEIQLKERNALLNGNEYEVRMHQLELRKLLKSENVNPLSFMVPALIQGLTFMSFFWALYPMADLPVESLKTGGCLWFPDLTQPDRFFAMPVFCGGTMGYLLLFANDAFDPNMHRIPALKAVFYLLPAATVIFIANFSSFVVLYWATNNLFSLTQYCIFRNKSVQKMLDIEDVAHSKEFPPL